MALPSTVFTEMVTTTLRNTARQVSDNVSNNNALLRRMKAKGNIETVSGGYEIQKMLEYAENGTYQRFSGLEQLDTSASDVLTSAKFEWKQIALHVVASGRELRMNNSKEAMISLKNARIKNAMNTAKNNLSVDIYSDGSLTNQIGGLGNLVTAAGTGVVGGINSTTETWWRNQIREATGTNTAASPTEANSIQFKGDMNALWLSCVRGTDKPDCIVMTHDFYALYELGEQQLQRYASESEANKGFETLKYKTADVVFDDNTNFATSGETAFFLNSDYLYLVQHSEAQWSMDDAKKPTNQDAIVIPMYWMGNMCVTNRSLQGRLFDAA